MNDSGSCRKYGGGLTSHFKETFAQTVISDFPSAAFPIYEQLHDSFGPVRPAFWESTDEYIRILRFILRSRLEVFRAESSRNLRSIDLHIELRLRHFSELRLVSPGTVELREALVNALESVGSVRI